LFFGISTTKPGHPALKQAPCDKDLVPFVHVLVERLCVPPNEVDPQQDVVLFAIPRLGVIPLFRFDHAIATEVPILVPLLI